MALLAHTLALLALTVATVAIKVVPMDLAEDSFDAGYEGCVPAMNAKLQDLYFSELHNNPLFAWGWVTAKDEWQRRGSPVSPLASHWQALALMAYTSEDIYKEFNAAILRAGRSHQEYQDNFHFKTLHFLLTDALATLRHAQNEQCYNVFRGVRGVRFQAQKGDTVRFGQFTSTSKSKKVALRFGTDTIFEVRTCYGADIRQFSMFPEEEEVLIPPFEMFEVTKVNWDGEMTWISLYSVGSLTKHNCEVS
ncbi:erythroblast NAD(P)(+)--arginine ADP-ribosyltransferase-like [Passer montanus]|uniref:erythroblast NAD(P)(+)--arginine ADP-ribosyltransferase-like n=1 Tax=Passer montanus TaxID=9160 RepID=UPI001961A67A|nr:erythroblast NAD(P)(+)--arginine ADP-ribosyltransferase-like [Passer montanus]